MGSRDDGSRTDAGTEGGASGRALGQHGASPGLDQRLLHELQVHQLELNQQNLELREARATIESGLRHYTELFDFAPVGLFSLDRHGTIGEANLAAAATLGLPRVDVVGRCLTDFVATDHRSELAAMIERTCDGGPRISCEFRLAAGPVGERSVRIELATAADQSCLAALSDISERKKTDAALRDSEARFRSLADNSYDWIWALGVDGRHSYSNHRVKDILGFDRDLFLVADPVAFVHPDDRARYSETFRVAVATRSGWQGVLIRWQTAAGNWLTLESNAVPVFDASGELSGFHGADRDVTERTRIETALKASEARFRNVLNDIPTVAVQGYAPDGTTNYWNRASEKLYGYSADEAIGRNLLDLIIPPEMHEGVRQAMRGMFETGIPIPAGELSLLRKDGSRVAVFSSHACIRVPGQAPEMFCLDIDLTERKQAEETIRELNRDFVAFLENTSDFIYFKDAESRFRFCSQTLADITGHASWRDMTGKHDREVFPEETARIYHDEEIPIFRDGEPLLNRVDPYFDAAGRRGWVSTNKWPLFDPQGKVIGVFGISRDVTERKRMDEALQLAASVFSHSREAIMIAAPDGAIIEVNDAFTRITGYGRDEVIGRNPRLLNSGRHDKVFYAEMWRSLNEKGHWYGEIWNRRKDGAIYAEFLTITTVKDGDGEIGHFVALFSDITAQKAHQSQLEHIAHFDALTSLPNRVLLADRLHQAMAQAQRRGQRLAVTYLDLDGFKAVNDRHGHEAGDQLLVAVASRMKDALREGDTLARLGGDEFVGVLVDLESVESSVPMLARLLAAAAQPVNVGNLTLQVSASLGVTFYPQADEVDADQLMRQADQAMYQAKVAGKNRYHVFDLNHDRTVRGHHESLDRIRQALAAGEFVLYYQPKVNMRSGALIGLEALIRWQHPERGLLSPAVFLPVIEDHPLAVQLGEWVIDEALAQIGRWQNEGLEVAVSVNVGARQLQQADFVGRLQSLLAMHANVRPSSIELEVLETIALEDLVQVSRVIEACAEIGVRFALDDFGTGYSSLTYLKRLSVTELKIDQSFVRDMLEDPEDLAILEGVLGLATAFRREVIAEGVETLAHGEMLLQLGCERGQGYGIARPMPALLVRGWAASWRPPSSWLGRAPVGRDQAPILLAGVEHRAWIVAMEAYLRGERSEAPPLDPQQCRFGAWLAGAQQGAQSPVLVGIDRVHREVHALGAELHALRARGDDTALAARLPELRRLRDVLLGELQECASACARN